MSAESDKPEAVGPATGAEPKEDVTRASFDRLEQLMTFPTDFPLKVMGKRADGFEQAVSEIVSKYVPSFDPTTIESRQSSQGSYLSLTVMLRIESRAQLEALHRDLVDHPMVKMVL